MKLLLYIATALLSFLVFLVIFAPASSAWSLVSEDVYNRVPDLNVFRVGGTIWDGQGEIQFRQFPTSALNWQLSPAKLINSTANFHFTAEGQGHSLQAEAALTRSSGALQSLKGSISSDYINAMSEQFGFTFSGELEIQALELTFDRQWITSASGSVHWTGGRILLNASANPQVIQLPPLDGELYFRDQQLILDITYEQLVLMQIILKEGGWAEVAVKGRLFDIANLPSLDASDPDETILLLEEKIL